MINNASIKVDDIVRDICNTIANGGREATATMKRLNLDIKHTANMSPYQQILQIADALEHIKTTSEKTYIMETLSRDASLLLPWFENKAEGFRMMHYKKNIQGKFIGALWENRWSFIPLVLLIWAFIAGAAIEHYFPNLLTRLWL